jgi:hypothetical protein
MEDEIILGSFPLASASHVTDGTDPETPQNQAPNFTSPIQSPPELDTRH